MKNHKQKITLGDIVRATTLTVAATILPFIPFLGGCTGQEQRSYKPNKEAVSPKPAEPTAIREEKTSVSNEQEKDFGRYAYAGRVRRADSIAKTLGSPRFVELKETPWGKIWCALGIEFEYRAENAKFGRVLDTSHNGLANKVYGIGGDTEDRQSHPTKFKEADQIVQYATKKLLAIECLRDLTVKVPVPEPKITLRYNPCSRFKVTNSPGIEQHVEVLEPIRITLEDTPWGKMKIAFDGEIRYVVENFSFGKSIADTTDKGHATRIYGVEDKKSNWDYTLERSEHLKQQPEAFAEADKIVAYGTKRLIDLGYLIKVKEKR